MEIDYEQLLIAYLQEKEEYSQRAEQSGCWRNLSENEKFVFQQGLEQFFQSEVRKGWETFQSILMEVTPILANNLQVDVFLTLIVSGKAVRYNEELGKRRMQTIRNYFANYQDGILRPYLKNNQINILETVTYADPAEEVSLRCQPWHLPSALLRRVEVTFKVVLPN